MPFELRNCGLLTILRSARSYTENFFTLTVRNFSFGVWTYGPFRPDANGDYYKGKADVARDFAAIAAAGANTASNDTSPPPLWLLDVAEEYGLKVLLGKLRGSSMLTFLDDARRRVAR